MSHGISKIIQRLGGRAEESLITEAYSYLERSKRNSRVAEGEFQCKERETEALEQFINEKALWYDFTSFSTYLDEGAEQKVFIDSAEQKVIKINDAIFYVNWSQYLESLFIHNLLFEETRYRILGFLKINELLYTVVEQDYIGPTEKTSIDSIRNLMLKNGFTIKKNNDYIHNKLGLIIEDLHEENVLTVAGTLFFIDTVIYLKD